MSSFFQRYLEEFRVSDAVFAQAYEALGDRKRSILKKWISRLYCLWGKEDARCHVQTTQWNQGMTTHTTVQPLDWTLLILSPTFSSPAQLLAALLPPLLSNTPHVIVAREQNDAPLGDGILTAMELAGQEGFVQMAGPDLKNMVRDMFAHSRHGKVCHLGVPSTHLDLRTSVPSSALWMQGARTTAGLWFDPSSSWDLETLSWTLPDTEFYAGGNPPENTSLAMHPFEGSLEEFAAQDFDALYLVSPEKIAYPQQMNMFGPGQEGGWVWPDLTPSSFSRTSIVWQSNRLDQEEM